MSKRILIVGAGGIGLKHIRAFNGVESRPKLCAIDPRRESLERAAELGVEPIDAAWCTSRNARIRPPASSNRPYINSLIYTGNSNGKARCQCHPGAVTGRREDPAIPRRARRGRRR